MANEIQDDLFVRLFQKIQQQQELLSSIAQKLQDLELGKGMATLTDYKSGTTYKRNQFVVDTQTEVVYRTTKEFTASTVATDCANGNLKLVGFESQIVTFDHEPTQYEINTVPDGAMVTIYSTADTPYLPGNSE